MRKLQLSTFRLLCAEGDHQRGGSGFGVPCPPTDRVLPAWPPAPPHPRPRSRMPALGATFHALGTFLDHWPSRAPADGRLRSSAAAAQTAQRALPIAAGRTLWEGRSSHAFLSEISFFLFPYLNILKSQECLWLCLTKILYSKFYLFLLYLTYTEMIA